MHQTQNLEGNHPYKVRYKFLQLNFLGNRTVYGEVFYAGTKEGQHKAAEKLFKKDYRYLKAEILGVDYLGEQRKVGLENETIRS